MSLFRVFYCNKKSMQISTPFFTTCFVSSIGAIFANAAGVSRRGGSRQGTVPHWRGIFDDDDRLMVAINFNMDMGDAWEHADDPWYPEPYTALAYRFAVNYLIYSMTH